MTPHVLVTGGATVHLGTGRGLGVLEVLAAFERTCGRALPRDLDAMCADTWRWQSTPPHGYDA